MSGSKIQSKTLENVQDKTEDETVPKAILSKR